MRLGLGMALLASEKREDALRQLERVLVDDPHDKTAQTYVEGLREELGVHEKRPSPQKEDEGPMTHREN